MDYQDLILDMLNRIVKLEKEVESLKSSNAPILSAFQETAIEERPQQRDKTRYMFNGNIYLKNKLVLAVVKDYVSKNQGITCKDLKDVFDKSLQGSIGVVEYEGIAKQRKDYQVRFFEKEEEILRLVDGNMLVCSQWGILNISNFIKRAAQLGYTIEEIEREEKTRRNNMLGQNERDLFWKYFDEYVEKKGNEFYVTHIKNGVNQAAGNINDPSPMSSLTICCEYKYREQVILVQFYLRGYENIFERLYFKKKDIENDLGYEVEWIKRGVKSDRVRRIQKKFYINKSLPNMVEEIYPYIIDFIRVFSRYTNYSYI